MGAPPLREQLAAVERFLLFVGYPRSGHSIVGALLNAHRDAVVAHELDAPPLIVGGCSRDELLLPHPRACVLVQHARKPDQLPVRSPGQWQGRFETLRVIGDKRGGSVTRRLTDHPDFFERVRSLVGIPLRLVHVVRNPFDNISAISIWHDLSLEESVTSTSHTGSDGEAGRALRAGGADGAPPRGADSRSEGRSLPSAPLPRTRGVPRIPRGLFARAVRQADADAQPAPVDAAVDPRGRPADPALPAARGLLVES